MYEIGRIALLLLIAGVGLMAAAFAWAGWMPFRELNREDAP